MYSISGCVQVYSVAGGMQVYSIAGCVQVYSIARCVQVYSVTNYSTCCFLLHLQLSQNYIKELSWTQHPIQRTLTRTHNNCDLVVWIHIYSNGY